MRSFFSKYGYTVLKLFLNQFAIALFGLALSIACGAAENTTLQWVTSLFAVLFYVFLEYAVMWEVGAKDGIFAAARKQPRKLWRGLLISLCANALNLLFALLVLPGAFAPRGSTLSGMSAVFKIVAMLLQGMYSGLLALPLGGIPLNGYAWVYFAIVVPAVLVSSVAYILGQYDLHFTNILIPKNKDVKNNGRPK